MKIVLLLMSSILITVWIIGFFILGLPPAIHILLAVSIVIYIRSIFSGNDSVTQKYYRVHKNIK